MFDLSFGKLAIIFTLCLIVLGPEKLPKLAAQLGRWTGQARAMARHFREQLEAEIAAEQLQKEKRELEQSISHSVEAAKTMAQSAAAPLNETTAAVENIIHPHASPIMKSTAATPSDDSAPSSDADGKQADIQQKIQSAIGPTGV